MSGIAAKKHLLREQGRSQKRKEERNVTVEPSRASLPTSITPRMNRTEAGDKVLNT